MTLEALRRGDLAGARALHLNAGLTEFPTEIFGLADTLEVLDLAGNALTALPADMRGSSACGSSSVRATASRACRRPSGIARP
jgi:hypothetical protein